MREAFCRSHDILGTADAAKETVTVIGCGAVGGWSAFLMAKLGVSKIRLIDFDKVAIENVGAQFFGVRDIGRPKVEALRDRIVTELGADAPSVSVRDEKWQGQPLSGIIIAAVDCIDTRKEIFEKCRMTASWLIDARMLAESFDLHIIQLSDAKAVEQYGKTFFSKSDAPAIPCTSKATSYCGAMIGALITERIKAILKGQGSSGYLTADVTAWDMTRIR